MDLFTLLSKLRLAFSKVRRYAFNLGRSRTPRAVLSEEPAWKKLRGAASKPNLMDVFTEFRVAEREREEQRP